MIRRLFCLLAFSICSPAALAATEEPLVTVKDLPRIKLTETRDALTTFQIKKGFRLELGCIPELSVAQCRLQARMESRLQPVGRAIFNTMGNVSIALG